MSNEPQVYQPMRRQLGLWCGFIFLVIVINVHYLLNSNSIILYVSLAILTGMFIFLFMPFLKNQKLIISNECISLFAFGKINELTFHKNLKEVVIKDNEIVSYRFESRGNYYQISPNAYHQSEKLKSLFSDLIGKYNIVVSVVEK